MFGAQPVSTPLKINWKWVGIPAEGWYAPELKLPDRNKDSTKIQECFSLGFPNPGALKEELF